MLRPRSQSAVLLFCASYGGDGHRDALMPSTPLWLWGTSVAAPPVPPPTTAGPRPPPLSPHYPSRRPLVPAVCRMQCQRPPRRKAGSCPCNRLGGQRGAREGTPPYPSRIPEPVGSWPAGIYPCSTISQPGSRQPRIETENQTCICTHNIPERQQPAKEGAGAAYAHRGRPVELPCREFWPHFCATGAHPQRQE